MKTKILEQIEEIKETCLVINYDNINTFYNEKERMYIIKSNKKVILDFENDNHYLIDWCGRKRKIKTKAISFPQRVDL